MAITTQSKSGRFRRKRRAYGRKRPTRYAKKSAYRVTKSLSLFQKGRIHNFSRYTNTLGALNHNNWSVAPAADATDGSSIVFTSQAAAAVGYAGIGFRLADLQNYTEFSNLFDHYMIRGVQLTFSFLVDNNTLGGGFLSPQLYIVTDYDDNTVPASVGELIQYPHCQQINLHDHASSTVSVFIRPRVMNAADSAQQPRSRQPWIDMASPTVVYNGIKIALVDRNAAASTKFYVKAKYYITCKGQR